MIRLSINSPLRASLSVQMWYVSCVISLYSSTHETIVMAQGHRIRFGPHYQRGLRAALRAILHMCDAHKSSLLGVLGQPLAPVGCGWQLEIADSIPAPGTVQAPAELPTQMLDLPCACFHTWQGLCIHACLCACVRLQSEIHAARVYVHECSCTRMHDEHTFAVGIATLTLMG